MEEFACIGIILIFVVGGVISGKALREMEILKSCERFGIYTNGPDKLTCKYEEAR
jgi:hypothetical protein